jgi:hypothetical protein
VCSTTSLPYSRRVSGHRVYKRGQIVVDGVFYPSGSVQALSILGGTGEFKGAGGVVRSFDTPDMGLLVFHFTS